MSLEQDLKDIDIYVENTLQGAEILFAMGDSAYWNDDDEELREYYYAHACGSIALARKREELGQMIRSLL